jgi:hypothetical protein
VADIPETEMFYRDRSPLVSKFASSAAHTTGRRLVAAETGTWMKEHFTETLGDMKELVDLLFLAGVNHVVYHGCCYSPDEAGWPGWLFYASTEMNPRNPIWRDAGALNAYIARCQAVLQAGRPDNDLLVYYPIYDVWHNPKGLQQNMTVHGRYWIEDQPVGKTAQWLWDRGYQFDFVSDRQLGLAKVEDDDGQPGYRLVLVPPCDHMPVETFRRLLALGRDGAKVVFCERLPRDVPGLRDADQRRRELTELQTALRWKDVKCGEHAIQTATLGEGMLIVGPIEAAVPKLFLPALGGEAQGLMAIRRALDDGKYYFVANRGQRTFDDWVFIDSDRRGSLLMLDPMTGQVGTAPLEPPESLTSLRNVYLQLEPGQSVIILRTSAKPPAGVPAWTYRQPGGPPQTLDGQWQVEFIAGGPELPPAVKTDKLVSWTQLGGEPLQRFAGTARYTLRFDAPAQPADGWQLDLGRVCQSARVCLNNDDLGVVFTAPFRVAVGRLLPKDNRLQVEVTSVAANRIRDLDRRGVKWRTFHDINFVNIAYKPFDASDWPLTDCGLLGPVRLIPSRMSAVPPPQPGGTP